MPPKENKRSILKHLPYNINPFRRYDIIICRASVFNQRIITKVPAVIRIPPITVLNVKSPLRITRASILDITTLNLSIGTTLTHHRVEVLCSRIAKKDLWQFRKYKEYPAFAVISCIPLCAPVIKTIPHAIISTTIVLIAVARFEFMSLIPILQVLISAAKMPIVLRKLPNCL